MPHLEDDCDVTRAEAQHRIVSWPEYCSDPISKRIHAYLVWLNGEDGED